MANILTHISCFTYGTARHSLANNEYSSVEKIKMVRTVLDKGIWLHIGYKESEQIVAQAFRESNITPNCILKAVGNTSAEICKIVDDTLSLYNLDTINIVQLYVDESASFNSMDPICLSTCNFKLNIALQNLKTNGKVGEFTENINVFPI